VALVELRSSLSASWVSSRRRPGPITTGNGCGAKL